MQNESTGLLVQKLLGISVRWQQSVTTSAEHCKCWHCLEVPGPLSGTQSAARWLPGTLRGETERPTGQTQLFKCSFRIPSQGISWVAHLPEHSRTCLPGSPPHRHLAEGSPSPALPATDLFYHPLSRVPALLMALAQGTGKNLSCAFHNPTIPLSPAALSCC